MQFKYGKIRTIISLFRFLSAASALSSPLMIRSTTETWFFMAKEQMPFASFVQRLIGVCIRSTILFTASRDITSVSCSRMLYTFKPCTKHAPQSQSSTKGQKESTFAFSRTRKVDNNLQRTITSDSKQYTTDSAEAFRTRLIICQKKDYFKKIPDRIHLP